MSSALSGIVVLDFSRLLPGPFCSMRLAEMGATVIKLERKGHLDPARFIPPLNKKGESLFFQQLHQRKKSVILDFEKKSDQEKLGKLIQKADVFIESFRPGVLKKLGLDPKKLISLNPQLIIVSITGYGQKGLNKAGHDLNFMALAGCLSSKEISPIQWADLVGGGLSSVIQIQSALLQRQKTKKGQWLDISMTDQMMGINQINKLISHQGTQHLFTGSLARYRVYETKDNRWMALAALEQKFWNQFCEASQLSHLRDDTGNYPDVNPDYHRTVEKFFLGKNQKEWIAWAKPTDFCLTPVLTALETGYKK